MTSRYISIICSSYGRYINIRIELFIVSTDYVLLVYIV